MLLPPILTGEPARSSIFSARDRPSTFLGLARGLDGFFGDDMTSFADILGANCFLYIGEAVEGEFGCESTSRARLICEPEKTGA